MAREPDLVAAATEHATARSANAPARKEPRALRIASEPTACARRSARATSPCLFRQAAGHRTASSVGL
jgi:hypothetical protein